MQLPMKGSFARRVALAAVIAGLEMQLVSAQVPPYVSSPFKFFVRELIAVNLKLQRGTLTSKRP